MINNTNGLSVIRPHKRWEITQRIWLNWLQCAFFDARSVHAKCTAVRNGEVCLKRLTLLSWLWSTRSDYRCQSKPSLVVAKTRHTRATVAAAKHSFVWKNRIGQLKREMLVDVTDSSWFDRLCTPGLECGFHDFMTDSKISWFITYPDWIHAA
jgi:hypothetical protein